MFLRTIVILVALFSAVHANAQESVKEPAVYFDVHVGSATRLGKKDPNPSTRNHSERLRSGVSFDVSLYFRAKTETSHFVGFKYNTFRKEVTSVAFNPGSSGLTYSDNINLDFYGVGYLYADVDPDGKSEWNFETALGYMTYKNKAAIAADTFEINGGSVGVYAAGAYYIKIYKSLFLGPKLALLLGSVRNLEVTGLNSGETIDPNYIESLSRVDVSGVIRFKF